MHENLANVIIYTDGSCLCNPGPGGYCAILKYKDIEKIISGGEPNTTNNRMELMAVIKGLEALKFKCNVEVRADSAYVINSIENNWIDDWKKNNFKNGIIKNQDLFLRLDELINYHNVKFTKVVAHADDENNNRCDKIARDVATEYLKKATE